MQKIIDYLTKDIKLKNGDIVVIGNSAGPDSMALTDILLKIRKKLQIKIICAHVNHNVREESKEEEKFIEKHCQDNDIIFEKMLIEKYGDDNFHNEARMIRYNFFENIIKKYNANYLMTAHHGDDLMETILMRIVRGSSLKGYAGFKPKIEKETYTLVRPLIFKTKDEIKEYDDANNIPYYIDKSNFKTKYTRNRYRKTVLPFLKEEDPNVHEKFLKFSNKLFEYDNFVERESTKCFEKTFRQSKLDIKKYKEFDQLIQHKIISKMLERYYQDDLILINDSHIKLIQDLIYSKKQNAYICLPNDIIVKKTYQNLEITNKIDEITDYNIELIDYVKLPNNHTIEKVNEEESNDNNICRINSTEVLLPLSVRTRKIGDKMKLKKIEGYRKIKDIFIDSKVDFNKRDKWPIVVDSRDEIIWIPGIKKSKFTKTKDEKCDIIYKYK